MKAPVLNDYGALDDFVLDTIPAPEPASGEVRVALPPKVVYAVHPDERDHLEDVVQPLCRWGLYWSEKTGAPIAALEE